MSDAQNQHDHDGPHEGPIKTPKQLILAVLYAFVVPVIVIVLLVEYVTSDHRPAAGTEALAPAAVAERIRPVGMVQVKDASDLSTLKTGEQVFAAQCTTCHTAGLVGAPKLGDADAWGPRLKTGYDALLHSALAGKGNMGAQGGGDYTDLEIGRAVVYMANKAGGKFDEPKAPAAGASAAAATTAAAPAPMAAPAAAAAPASAAAPAAAPVVAAAAPAKADAAGAVPALYTQLCQTCHATGVAGAPKVGDKAAWAARLAEAKDIDGVTAIAIKGKGAMPPKGGSTASDAEIKAVVTYMVNASK
ncbi:cytochrome c5 family protein [Rhizobacter sp. Root404]|uniref:c-type cytochrome n=1 Tax=Rhizobacter sp. Root404 TaxID=1736528 RepID=UPI0006F877D9|nr:c-type cytochrome [Rhizobacter sp. Root404]KQW34285.1 cytochrome C [Rhizobacter sp. Root404]